MAPPKRPTMVDAEVYLKRVKNTFKNENHKLQDFFKVLCDYKRGRIGVTTVYTRVTKLFKSEHRSLLEGFKVFLPTGLNIRKASQVKIDLSTVSCIPASDTMAPPKRLTKVDAKVYLKRVEDTFKNENHKLQAFLEVLKDYKRAVINVATVYTRVSKLFEYEDRSLLEGFKAFLPTGLTITKASQMGPNIGRSLVLKASQSTMLDLGGLSGVENEFSN